MYVYSVIQSKWPHHPDPRMSKGKKRKKRKKERKKVEPNSSITKIKTLPLSLSLNFDIIINDSSVPLL